MQNLDRAALDEQAPNRKSALPFPVVGIGASAGGIVALTHFFEQVDKPFGMAFVVILHLSPAHESNVAAILQRVTTLTVTQVSRRTVIEPDHVYVIPPNRDLNMDDGHLSLRDPTRDGVPVAVDLFLRTLAEVHGERAFAIVLSGLGSDGALGVRRINECGGVSLAQLPSDAEFDSMPRAAIATGVVDVVIPVAEMPARLLALWRNARHIDLSAGTATSLSTVDPTDDARNAGTEQALRETLSLLHKRTRHDFRHYKRATVLRRLERRLQVNAVPDLQAYRDYLDAHPAETSALLQDMLISVTSFFRDPQAFAALEATVIPALFEGRDSTDTVRVWVAACATGEEAYTFAILLREYAETLADAPALQVFATDIDERAIAIGRAGAYPEGIANDLSANRLRRFFRREGDRYRVVASIRESVLFAVHNVLRDPPFSRLDVISCRNLLIYLDAEAQKSMLELFRFALRADGHLFLGSSESGEAIGNAFRLVDKKHRLYELDPRALVMRRPAPPPPAFDRMQAQPPAAPASGGKRRSDADRHRWALEHHALPSVLIDARQQILHMSPGAGAFFTRSAGTPSHDVVANTQPELRAEMSTAVFRARQTREGVSIRATWTPASEARQDVVIVVQPYHDAEANADFALVTLQRIGEAPSGDGARTSAGGEFVRQLEAQVRQLKDHLKDTIDRSDTSTEELRASNEELQAINEELRSATEELETSKEELQSINEELTTVNFELKSKVDETIQINDDLQNLIASTDIAVVFVDARMRVKRYTPRATELFNLIPADVGRSLLDITHHLESETITQDAEEAFRTLHAIEREARSDAGNYYLSRVIPYRTTGNRIEGAVMTFVDITSRVLAERKVGENEERLRAAGSASKVTRDIAGTNSSAR